MGTVTVKWMDSLFMAGIDSKGQSIALGWDENRDPVWTGTKPSDLLLLAAASCSAYDVILILTKQREPVENFEVYCTGEQQAEEPYTFTKIHLHYKLWGSLNASKVERAIKLSEEKYCSVINTLKAGVEMSSDFEIVN